MNADRAPLQPVLANGTDDRPDEKGSVPDGSKAFASPLAAVVSVATTSVAPVAGPDARPLRAAPAAIACDASGCGCGDDEPIPLTPEEWIALLDDDSRAQSERDWLGKLSEAQFRVLRMGGTEDVDIGEYNEHFEAGTYACAGCAQPLYDSSHKFRSGHGWPAFFDALPGALERHTVKRKVEITCSGCGGHMGHVFKSSRYPKPTNERHCVNSVSLLFAPRHDGSKE